MASAALPALVLAALLALGGCGRRDPAEMLAAAQASLARHDLPAATIELKNLLQAQPDSGPARMLLGQVLLEQGDARSADIELRRAQELRVPDDQLAPLQAQAQLALGDAAAVVERYRQVALHDVSADAELRVTVARALAALGRFKEAGAEVDRALVRAPKSVPARVLQARIKAAEGDVDGALGVLETLLLRNPDSAEAWLLSGELQWIARHDAVAAEAAFRKALALRADQPDAHAALISIAFAQRDVAAAAQRVAAMKQALPRHPQTAFFEAQLAAVQGDPKRARALLQPLLQRAPHHVPTLVLAAIVELTLNAPQQAEGYLLSAVKFAPDHGAARRLLAQAELQLRQPGKAMAALRPALDRRSADSTMLALAGQAALMLGDVKTADDYFTRAARMRPDDARLRAVQAVRQAARGQPELAYSELQTIAAADSGSAVDLALIGALLRKGDSDAALKAIAALQRKQADSPLPPNLRARVLVLRQDVPGARAAFEQALALDPKYVPALAGLAALDLAAHQPEAARARYEALLKAEPRNVAALLSYAEFSAQAGAPEAEVTRLIEQAVAAEPDDATPRLALIDHRLAAKDGKGALAAAQAGVAALPGNSELLERLARLQLAAGQREQARSSFGALVSLAPDNAAGYLGLAQLRMVEQDLPGAEQEARRALQHDPDSWPARRMAITLALRQQRPQDAVALAREQQKRRPDDALAFVTEGEIEAGQQHWDAAIAALRGATLTPEPGNAPARLHAVLLQAQRPADAAKFADTWTRSHPADLAFVLQLGEAALTRGDHAAAEQHYLQLLKRRPDDVSALNNVAWLRLQQRKPGALEFAQRALALAPGRPELMDTCASALAAENQLPRALEMQKQAVAKAPAVPVYRLNLAKLYLRNGDKSLARAELERAAAAGDAPAVQAEAAQMLKTLTAGS